MMLHLVSDLCVKGTSKKLRMTGRPSDVVGVLASSKLYTLGNQILAFFPQVGQLISQFNRSNCPFKIIIANVRV